MNRKAVLIESSNVKGHKDLPGARVDIDNWNLFLHTDYGGGWTDSEIVILRKPGEAAVKEAIDVKSDCYCFVAYAGHGHEGSLVLNDTSEYFPLSYVTPKGEKGTMVIDACRGPEEGKIYNFSKMEKFANESRSEIVTMNARKAESMEQYERREAIKSSHTANAAPLNWMRALKEASKGTVKMYACSTGEIADDDPNSGGYYTSFLMKSAEVWCQQYTIEKIYTTKDAHDCAAKKVPGQQHPIYSPSWLAFPFAAKG